MLFLLYLEDTVFIFNRNPIRHIPTCTGDFCYTHVTMFQNEGDYLVLPKFIQQLPQSLALGLFLTEASIALPRSSMY